MKLACYKGTRMYCVIALILKTLGALWDLVSVLLRLVMVPSDM